MTGPAPVTLTWADGDMSDKFITIQLKSDCKHEPDETFRIELSNPTGGALLDGAPAPIVTIVDNDDAGGGGFGAFGALLLGAAGALRRRS